MAIDLSDFPNQCDTVSLFDGYVTEIGARWLLMVLQGKIKQLRNGLIILLCLMLLKL